MPQQVHQVKKKDLLEAKMRITVLFEAKKPQPCQRDQEEEFERASRKAMNGDLNPS